MRRWFLLIFCALLGLVLLACGLLLPAHLRAVDAKVIERAGKKTRSLVDEGFFLLTQKQLGPAQQLFQAAKAENLPGQNQLEQALGQSIKANPTWFAWGCAGSSLESLFPHFVDNSPAQTRPLVEFLIQAEHRHKVLDFLNSAGAFEVRNLVECRALTNLSVFSPTQSAAGQPWETALAMTGLLLHEHRLKPSLHTSLVGLALDARRGANSQKFEQMLLDLMSLGQRFNWGQLTDFVGQIDDSTTLGHLAHFAQKRDGRLPVLFSAVHLSGKPGAVEKYLTEFGQSGSQDLAAGLHYGTGGLKELLQRKRPLYYSRLRNEAAQYEPCSTFLSALLEYCWLTPWAAISLKWFFYLSGGFFFALAMHYGRPAVSVLERPLQVRGFHLAREFLFALGFLLVVLLLSEPFLAQESQKVQFLPFRLRLPMVGHAVSAGLTRAPSPLMNQLSLLTLLLFFVLQALIYTACLVKLAEIARQMIPSRLKLKLLENEDHLFDAGLYLGFVGTIISLILVSLGVIKPSLMAAYSSTSFGIMFVSIFKIFHLRPLRRKLLLESESMPS